MAKKVQLQTNGKEWQVVDGEQVLVDVEKQDIDPITSSSCVQIEGFRTLEEAVSDNKMLSQDLTYTKVMDKVGGDYHQNVLDGQYSKAILYGNTQVNLCEEDSSVALQIPTTFTSFNNGELQIKNKESQVVAPLIKGVTMVNLAQTNSSSVASGKGVPIQNVKGNTLYTLSFTFTTKNTNSGVVIECYDVNGEYLGNVMHKTGLGDVVKFTFTTHVNATKIHICNNAAYGGETIQLDEIMLIEGDQTALDIPFFKGMKSVELVRPLTNLFTDTTPSIMGGVTVTNSNGTVVATSVAIDRYRSVQYKPEFKANTDYVVIWDTLTYTHTVTSDDTVCVCKNDTIIANPVSSSFIFKNRSIKFNTGSEPSTITLRVHATLGNTETATTTVTGLRVFEYDDYLRSIDLQSIGWFSGTKNVAVEPIKTCSKNLYPYGDINFTPTSTGWFDAKGNASMTDDIASKSQSRFLLKKGTYYFSIGSNTNAFCQLTSDKENMGVNANSSFTLQEDKYVTLRVKVTTANTLTTVTNIQIERGETATDYVAHNSRYYEPNGQNAIMLRSLPDGVCDTFNLQTGEYTRKIGEIIIDGSEDWTLNKSLGDGSFNQFTVGGVQAKKIIQQKVVCDRLISKAEEAVNNVIWIYDGTTIVIQSSCTSVDELRTWLQQNPLTVQYEFREPITTIIPRTIKRNNNGTVSTIDFKTYTNKESLVIPNNPSYLTINSMTSIKPVVEPITYLDFKTRLKANTDYSVIIDKDSTGKTINLGGTSKTYTDKMLVRTPSIDLEQNLRISGGGSIQNIMVIEGDVLDKELPYFNGMCNVKMPIVRNMGRNLLDNNNVRVTYDTNIILRAYPTFPCKPGKRYVYCVDKLGVESACNWYSCKRDTVLVNGSKSTGIIKYLGYSTSVVAPPDCKYLSIYTGGLTSVDPYSIPAYVYEMDTIAEAKTIGYTDYKENQICLTQGEIRLTPDMFEQGNFGSDASKTYEENKNNGANRYRTKSLIKVEPNTTYEIRYTEYYSAVYEYGKDEKKLTLGYNINKSTLTITTSNNCYYLAFSFVTSTLPTQYISIIKVSEIVQLRSLPNGVKDELNLLTGEYIQRVGEIVLDGSENEGWNIGASSNANLLDFYIHNIIPNALNNGDGISDKFNYINQVWDVKVAGICVNLDKGISMMLPTKYVKTQDLQGCLEWLQQNPITVQYQLAEPIISYPRIVSNTQEREIGIKLPNGICDTYNSSTGITVKRVGKVVLDGSEDWKQGELTNNTHFEAWLPSSPLKDMKLSYEGYMEGYFTNMFKVDGWATPHMPSIGLVDGRMCVKCGTTQDLGAVSIGILKSKLPTQDVDGFKAYLASNPLTVYYELANPIVTTDIVLPNGVHDEYNPLTGLYTKRVGYVELDGSDDEGWSPTLGTGNSTHCYASISIDGTISPEMKYMANNDEVYIMSNAFETVSRSNYSYDREQLYVWSVRTAYLNILQSRLSTLDIDGFRQYLSQNPIKLWYELQNPITYQLTPYFGLPMPYAYKDGYLIMDSAYDGQTLPPEITYQLTVNRTGQITQNNIKLKEHTDRLSNLEYILIEATLDSIFDREMQNFELELMNIELLDLDE